MFIGCDYVSQSKTKTIDYSILASSAFENQVVLTYTELKRRLHEIESKSLSTARNRINDLLELEYIRKDDNGNYRMAQ